MTSWIPRAPKTEESLHLEPNVDDDWLPERILCGAESVNGMLGADFSIAKVWVLLFVPLGHWSQ
jgi:hypothetical protein